MKGDRICPKCKSNKFGFDTLMNNPNKLRCGGCGNVFDSNTEYIKEVV